MYLGNIERLPIANESIDLIFTDPPYPKKYLGCYEWLASEAVRVLKPGGFVLTMAGGLYLNQISGDAPYIWQRNVIAKSKVILAYSKGEGKPRVNGVQSCYQSIGKMKAFHHWGQDVASARYFIDYFSKEKDLVLDPFVGGGTTHVACTLINRHCISGDIDPKAIIITRDRLRGENAPMVNMPLWESSEDAIQ